MMTTDTTRTLTIELPESEWRALSDAEPDAVAWIHAQIRSRVAPPPKPAEWSDVDEY